MERTLTIDNALVAASFACAALLGTPTAAAAVPDYGAIDAYVDAERRAMRIPGLALGIVGDKGLAHVGGFGSADSEGRPVTADTPFILGSTSKSFTALAAMQLVEEGRVELDAPVQRYLPWFRVADADASARITVRQLLNQTSGLSTATGRATLTDFSAAPDALEQRVRHLRDVALTTPVGTTYQYSNCNYQVLGLIVQQVSGEPFEAYLASNIFTPLGMQHTFTSKEDARGYGLATGHRAWFGRPIAFDEPLPRGSIPQGFIISSARDMTTYLAAHMNGGTVGDTAVLSPEGIAELHRGAVREGAGPAHYAMGWSVIPIDGTNAIWHAGDTFSFKSTIVVLTDERWGVVMLTNKNDILANQRVDELTFNVARMLTGRPVTTEHANDSAWAYTVFLGGFLLQLLGMARTVRLTRRWRREPARRPTGFGMKTLRLVLPALANAAWGMLVLVWIPYNAVPLDALWMTVPDLGRGLILSGAIALLWSVLRTVLVRMSWRDRHVPNALPIA
jgi:CubicO group peptidase (beta-lactamase class C family)